MSAAGRAIALVWVVLACATAQPIEQAEAVLERLWPRYVETLKRGDASEFAQWFTEDGVLIEPNMRDLRGREAIRAAAAPIFATVRIRDAVVTPGDTLMCDGAIHQFGRYTETVAPQGQAEATTHGRYFVIWRQQRDGSWKISHLMVGPAEPSPPATSIE